MPTLTEQLLNGSISPDALVRAPLSRHQLLCEPISIGMGVMAAGTAAMSIKGQMDAASTHNSTEEYRRIETENAIEENRRRATRDYLDATRLEMEAQLQEHESVSQKSMDIRAQADRSVATGLASASERGVAGRTVDQISADFDLMADMETGRLRENQRMADRQHAESIRSGGVEWQNRVTSITPYIKTPASQIDFFSPVFKAGAQTLGTAGQIAAAKGGFAQAFTGSGFGAAKSNPFEGFPSVGV